MEMAVAIAGFSAAEADELRQAMAAKRSAARMEKMRVRLYDGHGRTRRDGRGGRPGLRRAGRLRQLRLPRVATRCPSRYLVYSSSWLKLHYPAAFTAGLLNSQPMGFWSPQSLVADARRHGVAVRRPHVNRSEVGASLEGPRAGWRRSGTRCCDWDWPRCAGVGETTAERIVAGRPWSGGEDLVRRAGVTRAQLETLAAAGALDAEERATTASRRRLLWAAGAAAQGTPDRLPGIVVGAEAPPLPEPTLYDAVGDDLWALGLAPERTAMHLARERLEAMGVVVACDLPGCTDGDRVSVAGVVTHRQHPETAHGAVFVNLEDETGHVNVVFSRGAWARWKPVARHSPVLLIRGRLQLGQGTVTLTAERVEALAVGTSVPASRDFR